MYESPFPADDIWDKFGIPPVSLYSELLSAADGTEEPPQVVPSSVMGCRHDCMWAGTCSSGQHQRQCFLSESVVAVTVTVCPVKSSRSLLRTTRVRTRSVSPRPETPSESEEDESPVCGAMCDNEDLSVSVPVSEVTGRVMRTSSEVKTLSPPPSPVQAFYTDHSYHLSKTAVTLDNLGVQTPSDSEEEIDVVSVVDREKLTTLPTNPSARVRQQLQRTVASAIQKRASRIQQRASRNRKRSSPTSGDEEKRSYKRRRACEDEEDPSEKRNQHNNMERRRREEMGQYVQRLRESVPSIANNKRASKVLILRESKACIKHVERETMRLLTLRAKLTNRQRQLAARVSDLRRETAKMRDPEVQHASVRGYNTSDVRGKQKETELAFITQKDTDDSYRFQIEQFLLMYKNE